MAPLQLLLRLYIKWFYERKSKPISSKRNICCYPHKFKSSAPNPPKINKQNAWILFRTDSVVPHLQPSHCFGDSKRRACNDSTKIAKLGGRGGQAADDGRKPSNQRGEECAAPAAEPLPHALSLGHQETHENIIQRADDSFFSHPRTHAGEEQPRPRPHLRVDDWSVGYRTEWGCCQAEVPLWPEKLQNLKERIFYDDEGLWTLVFILEAFSAARKVFECSVNASRTITQFGQLYIYFEIIFIIRADAQIMKFSYHSLFQAFADRETCHLFNFLTQLFSRHLYKAFWQLRELLLGYFLFSENNFVKYLLEPKLICFYKWKYRVYKIKSHLVFLSYVSQLKCSQLKYQIARIRSQI